MTAPPVNVDLESSANLTIKEQVSPMTRVPTQPNLLRYRHDKTYPYRPEQWPDVVLKGMENLNKHNWFPFCTFILGLPGETREDFSSRSTCCSRSRMPSGASSPRSSCRSRIRGWRKNPRPSWSN